MNTKIFELKENGLSYALLVTKIKADSEKEQKLLNKGGFYGQDFYLVMEIDSKETHYLPYQWKNKDLSKAHLYILNNFDNLNSGDIITP